MKNLRNKAAVYLRAVPDMFRYEVLVTIATALFGTALGQVVFLLLSGTGRVAVTSGDFLFMFTTWQGILIIVITLLSLFFYIAIDLNSKIILSGRELEGKDVSVVRCIKEGFFGIRKMLSPRGLIIALYILLVSPVLGIGLTLSITSSLYVPTFISSVIFSTPIYLVAALAVGAVLGFFGIMNLFILHGMALEGLGVKDSAALSTRLMKKNWKNYLFNNIVFVLVQMVIAAVLFFVLGIIPLVIEDALDISVQMHRLWMVIIFVNGVFVASLYNLMLSSFYIMRMTELFYTYKNGEKMEHSAPEPRKRHFTSVVFLLTVAGMALFTVMVYSQFDMVFPQESKVGVIAHRAGGNEAPENTVAGFNKAYKLGAYGAETDIQRTKDGYYVINHDGDFLRVAGDKRTPGEMTLKETRKLRVDGEPVPTLEEALEAGKGKLTMFLELKGDSADKKMAEDVIKAVRKYKMEDQCVLISLNYPLIDYIETKYPEINTGFLLFVAFGKTEALNCDYIALEEESATESAIGRIHDENKKALVWTSNEESAQKRFLLSTADGLITDNVAQAEGIKRELLKRDDLDRMIDGALMFLNLY